jgi:hypothetical protein
MSKTALILATVATLGLSSATFANAATPAVKHQGQHAQVKAPVTPKRTVHWVGTRKYVVVHGHKVWLSNPVHGKGNKRLASHVPGSKQKRAKVSS